MPTPDVYFVALLVPPLWLGFVLAISFMEAPLKFRVPGVPRNVALSIGQAVFRALARVELVLWLLEGAVLWMGGAPAPARTWFAVLSVVVVVQQAWLLPRLDRRASDVLAGRPVSPKRRLHQVYVTGECAKLLVLPALSWSLVRAIPLAGA